MGGVTPAALRFRDAGAEDLPAIVALLADDALGRTRERDEHPLPAAYAAAFAAIQRQDGNSVVLAILCDDVVGCLQLTVIPNLSMVGTARAQVEGVRVSARHRGAGVGEALMRHAIARARAAGCGMVQLTTNKSRGDAQRFYVRLGFAASHEGMKLAL